MSRRQPERRCFPCGATFPTTTALGIHLASCPALSAGPVTREVHCWACASPIDLRAGRTCPTCGREYEEDHGA